MEELIKNISRLLAEVILPCLRTVQSVQAEQLSANANLQNSIDDLRISLESQFASLSTQLTTCRAELAAAQAVLQATREAKATQPSNHLTLVH